MRPRNALVCLLLTASWCCAPVWLTAQMPPPRGAAAPTSSGQAQSPAAYVIEQQHSRLRFEKDGRHRRDLALKVKVLDEQAVRAWGQFPLAYNSESEELTVSQIEVQKADGSIIKTDLSTIQDVAVRPYPQLPVFLDLHQKIPTVSALRPGDLLVLRASWATTRPTIPGQFAYAHTFNRLERVEDERLDIDVPAERIVNVKIGPDAPAELNGGRGTVSGDRRVYRWKTANLKVGSAQPDVTEDHEAPPPDVRLSTFQNWEEVGRWYRALLPAKTDERIAAKAAALTQGIADRTAKINALYTYVSTQVRYVSLSFGLGRYAPHAPAEVLSNQYGDCKDKGVLLTALLAALGIDSAPVLVSTTRSADPDFPSPLEFNHLITMVPGPDQTPPLWLDTTLEVAPFGMLADSVRDRRALLIAAASRTVDTPANMPFESQARVSVEGKVNALGSLDAKVTMTMRGDAELLARTVLRSLPRDAWTEFGRGMAGGFDLQGEVSEFDAADPADTREPFRISFHLHQRKYLDWAAATSEAPLPAPISRPGGWTDEDRRGRKRVQIGPVGRIDASTTIEFPAGYDLQAPVDVTTSSEGLTYRARYRVEGSRLIAERTLHNSVREISAARFGAYAAFAGAVDADAAQRIKVRGHVTATPAVPDDAPAWDVYEAALSSYNARQYETAVTLWQRTAQIDPKLGDAWVSLGLAYEKLRKYDEAAAAIQKQIDLDPYSKRAYGDLGFVLDRADRAQDAAKAYARHVELNPLDGGAFEKLGRIYLDLDRYVDAIPVLEKAVALNKPTGWAYTLLGQSYLYARRREDGLKAFDRALDLDSSLGVWTRMAWVLADTGTEPVRARDLAGRVIKRASEEMQATSIEAVRNRELDHVERLAWAWDTLALLELQQGNLGAAEKYAHAAWLLFGNREMAEHVGRVFEKQQRSAEAVNYFVLARRGADRPAAAVVERTRSLSEAQLEKIVKTMELYRVALVDEKTLSGRAQFVALVGADRRASGVRFVSGDAALARLTGALQRITYPIEFPDGVTSRLLLPLEVRCVATEGCAAHVARPDVVDVDAAPGSKK